MAATANGFYAAYGKARRLGGIPDAAARAAYAPYFSARLAGQLNQAAAAEAAYTKKFKAVPPLFEGDLFTSQFEGATGWTVQGCSGDARAGSCGAQYVAAPPSPAESSTVSARGFALGVRSNSIAAGQGLRPTWATVAISTSASGFTRPHWMQKRAGLSPGKYSA